MQQIFCRMETGKTCIDLARCVDMTGVCASCIEHLYQLAYVTASITLLPPHSVTFTGKALLKNVFRVHCLEMYEARFRSVTTQASHLHGIASRKPQRITITVPWSTYQSLITTSDEQGRSLSNTAAYWLERQADAMRQQGA
jgi:hypothetical protein